jgi:excisionase family DNA binding protein
MLQHKFLTTTDAAHAIGVSAETIRLWEKLGKLPAVRTESGLRLFSRKDVDRVAREYRSVIETRSAR